VLWHRSAKPSVKSPRRASAILALWQMGAHIDVQVAHDLLKHVAPGDRTVIQVDHFGNALKRKGVD